MSFFQVIRPRFRNHGFRMNAPGAQHNARFLASSIYIVKICLLGDDPADFPDGFVDDAMLSDLKQMAEFIVIFYAPWFLQARIPSVAPRLDLELWNNMCRYEVRCLENIMDSEILWEILKFPNSEYYPAGCAILEYGAAF